jgi:hypothetical protein
MFQNSHNTCISSTIRSVETYFWRMYSTSGNIHNMSLNIKLLKLHWIFFCTDWNGLARKVSEVKDVAMFKGHLFHFRGRGDFMWDRNCTFQQQNKLYSPSPPHFYRQHFIIIYIHTTLERWFDNAQSLRQYCMLL